jgi:hypothetical protein
MAVHQVGKVGADAHSEVRSLSHKERTDELRTDELRTDELRTGELRSTR